LSSRRPRPDGAPIYVIMDNLSAHKGAKIRDWAKKHKVELCFTPTNASWANPSSPPGDGDQPYVPRHSTGSASPAAGAASRQRDQGPIPSVVGPVASFR
jgi:hypothetical protein